MRQTVKGGGWSGAGRWEEGTQPGTEGQKRGQTTAKPRDGVGSRWERESPRLMREEGVQLLTLRSNWWINNKNKELTRQLSSRASDDGESSGITERGRGGSPR
jgi:hypothetical protein